MKRTKMGKGGLGNWTDVARAAKTASKCPRGTHTACVPNQAPSYEGYSFSGVGMFEDPDGKIKWLYAYEDELRKLLAGREFPKHSNHLPYGHMVALSMSPEAAARSYLKQTRYGKGVPGLGGAQGGNSPEPVMFRMWRGEVIALFVNSNADNAGHCQSYQHVGQHGAADCNGIIRESRPATPAEYASLKRELEGAPYHYQLRVMQRSTRGGLGCAECAPAPMAGLGSTATYPHYMVEGAARVLWASAWADVTEERGESHSGQELTEVAPPTPMEAQSLALSLIGKVARANGDIGQLLRRAAQADGVQVTPEFARSFGSDLAMMAMGTGVSWFDDHAEFPLVVPSVENYSLRDLV